MDTVGGQIYWSTSDWKSIVRAHLNGSGTQLLLDLINFTTYCRNDYSLALDVVRGHVYFRTVRRIYKQTVEYLCDISRSRLDGTDVEHIVSQECTVFQQLTHCQAALAIDVANGRLFYVREDVEPLIYHRDTPVVWRLVIWQVWVDPYPGTPSVFHEEEAKQRLGFVASGGRAKQRWGPNGTQMVVSGDHLYWSGTRRDNMDYQIKRAHLGRGDVKVFCCGRYSYESRLFWLGTFAVDEPGGYIYWLAALQTTTNGFLIDRRSGLARIQRTPILCEFPPAHNHECLPYVAQAPGLVLLLILVAAGCLAICLVGTCRRSCHPTDLVSMVAVLAVGVTLTLFWLEGDWGPIDYCLRHLAVFATWLPFCAVVFCVDPIADWQQQIYALRRREPSDSTWIDLVVVVAAVLAICYTHITLDRLSGYAAAKALAVACGWLVGLLCLLDVLKMTVDEISAFRRRVPSADRCILLVMCGVWDIVSDVSLCMLVQRVDPRFYVVFASICLPVLVACFLACRLHDPR